MKDAIAERGPSRQTGAICIRHYDDGHNPYADIHDRLAEARAKPLEPCKFKERYLLQHIATSKQMEARRAAKLALSPALSSPTSGDSGTQGLKLNVKNDLGLANGGDTNTDYNHVSQLEDELNDLEDELWGSGQGGGHAGFNLDPARYLEWEAECLRLNTEGWGVDLESGDESAKENDLLLICGVSIPRSTVRSAMLPDGTVALHSLLKSIYDGLSDEALGRLLAAANKQRPIPLVFTSARSLHRFYADVIKRFSRNSKASKRSGKAGLDSKEFMTFCRNLRVMSEKDAANTFNKYAVEAANSLVGKVMTADEFAVLYNM